MLRVLYRACSGLMRIRKKDEYEEGSWWGNNTISKTICDLNKICLFADKNGILQNTRQRKMFSIGDLIVAGEGEGPLFPSPKPMGIIVMSEDSVSFDRCVARLFGFDEDKIPTILQAEQERKKYCFYNNSEVRILSNDKEYDGVDLSSIKKENSFKLVPSSGWKGHIELE